MIFILIALEMRITMMLNFFRILMKMKKMKKNNSFLVIYISFLFKEKLKKFDKILLKKKRLNQLKKIHPRFHKINSKHKW